MVFIGLFSFSCRTDFASWETFAAGPGLGGRCSVLFLMSVVSASFARAAAALAALIRAFSGGNKTGSLLERSNFDKANE